MHTGTITLLFVEADSEDLVGFVTYPNMGGPGKIDHGSVFRRFQEDIEAFESNDNNRIFASRHHGCQVKCYTQLLFIVQDQPERRKESCLQAGNSTLHTMFGVCCDFNQLMLPFSACMDCQNSIVEYLAQKNWSLPPREWSCPNCLGWSIDYLTSTTYTLPTEEPKFLDDHTPGQSLFYGPGRLSNTMLLEAWNHCIDMFAVRHRWTEADLKKYMHRLCMTDATITAFVSQCRRHVTLMEMIAHPDQYPPADIDITTADAAVNPASYALPPPPALWKIGAMDNKTEGIMHLSMGIQKSVFKFVIRWAVGHKLGTKLQRRLETQVKAVQELKVAYCPCRPYKDDSFGGFVAETYRAMCMISCCVYRCLLEDGLTPSPPRGPNTSPQDEWLRQDNINWMYLRGVEFSSAITAPEAKAQVQHLLGLRTPLPILHLMPEPITTDEIRDLIWRMFNMFRAIFCTDICGTPARNRATASVMRFLSLMETLDLKLYPKRKKPIWIANYNFMGLLRVCESFLHFKHVRNLYKGGVIGEGVVKKLRPLVAKGVHNKWATNLLLAFYRQTTLDLLIAEIEDHNNAPKPCPLGKEVEASKFKRYTTTAEINYIIEKGHPLPILLYGSTINWKAGVIMVAQNRWYFKQLVFFNNENVVIDIYGLAYFQIEFAITEMFLGKVNEEFTQNLGEFNLPFWDYGILSPDLINHTIPYKYGVVRSSGWQTLNGQMNWSDHE